MYTDLCYHIVASCLLYCLVFPKEKKEVDEKEREEEEEKMSAKGKMMPSQAAALAKVAGQRTTAPRRRKRVETWNLYIYKVLKQVYPEMGMSKKSMAIMNSICDDIFERLAREAAMLCKCNNKQTMDATALKCAVRMVLPGEISKHAISEGQKALSKYAGSRR